MVINHNISFVTLVFCLIYVKLRLLQNGIFESLCIIAFSCTLDKLGKYFAYFNFRDLELPRNFAKIRRRENFPFYGMSFLYVKSSFSMEKAHVCEQQRRR